ncbi:MAG TPA: hypothetical protein VG410_14760 [Solirubrobacteraceae bacterium]|jgi:hypothetical protein|nr:hypothetical protein [Solirubrobacteraceae bacterium]
MVLSIIRFGVKNTEAVARRATILGFRVARMVIGAAVHTATGSRRQEAPSSAGDWEEAPRGPQPPRARVPQSEPPLGREPELPRDPERERRIELRDDPDAQPLPPSPHHELNNPVTDDPDPTEWPDPYDQRDDPLDPADVPPGVAPHPPTGATSTSSPHPSQDPEAEPWNGPKRSAPDR